MPLTNVSFFALTTLVPFSYTSFIFPEVYGMIDQHLSMTFKMYTSLFLPPIWLRILTSPFVCSFQLKINLILKCLVGVSLYNLMYYTDEVHPFFLGFKYIHMQINLSSAHPPYIFCKAIILNITNVAENWFRKEEG